MASFRYKAADEKGAAVAGVLVADTPEDARARLRQMGLFPERVEAVGRSAARWSERLPGTRVRNAAAVAILTRQCAVLLASGVPLTDALQLLARQTEHKGLALALMEIWESVNAGRSFADALSTYPQFFDRSYVGMIASGERSGTMDVVLLRLAEFLERRRMMQSRVSTAFIYPALLVLMVIALLSFLSVYVLPTIAPLLKQTGRPLPLSTELLFFVGAGVQHAGPWLLLLLAIAVGTFLAVRKRPKVRNALDLAMLRVPLFGRIWLKSLVARLTMSFSTLLRTGVPAVEALEVLQGMAPNAALRDELASVRADVVEGKEISARLGQSRFFPPMVGYMIAVGERSGNLADVLEQVSNAYDQEVEIASRRLLAILEPALVLIMAGVVGFIAMSLMVTILELSHI